MGQTFLHTPAILIQMEGVHLQFPSILGLASTHVGCDILLLLMLVASFEAEHEMSWKPPSRKTVCNAVNPEFQLVFHGI